MNQLKIALRTIPVLVFLVSYTSAEPWKLDLKSNVTMTMNTYSNNWTGKEIGSLTWGAQFLGIAEKQVSPLLLTSNTLKLAFGQTSTQSESASTWIDKWSKMQKSTDLIDFESLLKFTFKSYVDPYLGVRIITQFNDNSHKTHSHYINPINLTESYGISRTFFDKPTLTFNSRLAGATRQLIDRHPAPGQKSNISSGGAQLDLNLRTARKDKLIDLLSNCTIYGALISNEKDDENKWRYPDINWENTLTVNVTSYVMISIYLQLLYDKEIDDSARFKETLSLGLTYNFYYPKATK
jgi:hypothetical protein